MRAEHVKFVAMCCGVVLLSFWAPVVQADSTVSRVLEETEFSGWVAASYNYNFEGQDNGAAGTANRTSSHPSTNTVAVDQAWIALDNPASEPGQAGMHVDYEWGNVNRAGTSGRLYSAFVRYVVPIHDGLHLSAGLLPTLIGAEVNQTVSNDNVTRGLVWDWQPVTHVGVLVSAEIQDGWTASLGVVNDPLANPPGIVDVSNEKAVTGQVAYAGEKASASLSAVWGESSPGINTGFYDVVVRAEADKNTTAWVNYTLRTTDDGDLDGKIHGVAAAIRRAITNDMGVTLRGEALIFDLRAGDSEQYSITATVDQRITAHVSGRAEVRIDIDSDDRLRDRRGVRNQELSALFLAQLLYQF